MKLSNSLLKKMEAAFSEAGHKIRYEKGSFKSGYCILEKQKVIVINKFYDTEAKVSCLIDLLAIVKDSENLSESNQALIKKLNLFKAKNSKEETEKKLI